MGTARRLALGLLSVEVLVLVVTGAALFFLYEPTPSQAFGDAFPDNGTQPGDVLRAVHGFASWAALPTVVVAGVLLAARARPGERVAPGVLWAVGGAVVVAAAAITGLTIAYDQVAIRTVTAGGNVAGYHRWLWNDDVLFFLVDGTEMAPSTLVKAVLAHTVALGGATVAVVTAGWWRVLGRRPVPSPSSSSSSPADAEPASTTAR